jgi:dienelactone hydrolase
MRALLIALLALPVARPMCQTAAPPLWNGLTAGQFGVGFRRLEGGRTRVDVWYPSADTGRRMVFRDYVGAATDGLADFLRNTGIGSVTVDSFVNSPLRAIENGQPVTGRFPLVLLAHGNQQDAADQAILAEFLASNGFVVASTPSPMLRERMERQSQLADFAEMQAADLRAAVATVATVVPADTSRLFLVSHSFGARSALLLAMQDPRVRAIVSLDGGIGTATGIAELRAAPSFRAEARVPPLLHVYEELDAIMKPEFTLLRALRADTLVLERATAMRHVHFTSYGFAAAAFPEIATVTRASAETAGEVRRIADGVLRFLQAQSRVPGRRERPDA